VSGTPVAGVATVPAGTTAPVAGVTVVPVGVVDALGIPAGVGVTEAGVEVTGDG